MNFLMRQTIIPVAAILVCVECCLSFQPTEVVRLASFSSASEVPVGGRFFIAVSVDIEPGFHINSNKPFEELYRPTKISYKLQEGISFGKVVYPAGEAREFEFSEAELSVYENSIKIFADVTISDRIDPGEIVLTGFLEYQACNDQVCFLPKSREFNIPVKIIPAHEEMVYTNESIFGDISELGKMLAESSGLELTRQELEAQEVLDKGFLYAIAAFFVFGMALNLTPCVYPVIPITVSYFGSESSGRESSNFKALAYVIGIAIVFSLLGLLSGLAGKQWGFLFQSPWFVMIVTVIMLSMAASMFGAFEIRIPGMLMTRIGRAREGVLGAFLMGLTVGVVIAPCAAGIIIGLVGLVAKLGIILEGTILFFAMGLGLGLPYLILARFSNLLASLPKSGIWMVWVKKVFGILLIGVALYFFLPQAKSIPDIQGFFFGLLAIFGGLLLGFLDQSSTHTKGFKRMRWAAGSCAIILGIFLVGDAIEVRTTRIDWVHYDGEDLNNLIADGKPVFFDFYADWCAPCLEMDRKTYIDNEVVDLAANFRMIKVDCTAPDEKTQQLMEQFQVTGMPTLIFLDPFGAELPNLREVGYVSANRLANYMSQVMVAVAIDFP